MAFPLITKVLQSPYFSNITESHGSPFLNKFVSREVASCYHEGPVINSAGHDQGIWSYGDCRTLVINGNAKCGSYYKCKYETQEKLRVVEIYFDTPTFDKITKDAKTNDVAKLSMIGGTLGLLSGK